MTQPDKVYARSSMRLTEEALGVAPIDALHAQRDTLVAQVADLHAAYGSWGTFDHTRKIELARLAGLIRAEAVRDKVPKQTVAEIDDAAHSHISYYDMIAQATKDRALLYKLASKIENIDQEIQRANAIIRYKTSEARL